MSDDRAHLLDIHHAAGLIVQFVAELSVNDFLESDLVRSGVILQFLILGEATKRLSADFKARHPHLPWQAMAGMRDRLIHGYDSVNLEVVWTTATCDVPQLIEKLEPLISRPS